MALANFQWFSAVLGKQITTQVLLPDRGEGPWPTYYLLHGLSDDSSMWLRRSRVDAYHSIYPMMVVMPDGGRGFYTNNHDGPAWAQHIGEELPAMIERVFPARASREARAIGGLSMGGYGALRVGLAYGQTFSAIHAHSGVTFLSDDFWRFWATELGEKSVAFRALQAELRRIVGQFPVGGDHHLPTLARRALRAKTLPSIHFDCGTEDFLLRDNRALRAAFLRARVPHVYSERAGAHEWGYWDTEVERALAQLATHFGIKRF
jgi:putative tributyrin esterase